MKIYGSHYPRVTSIIEATSDDTKVQALMKWQKKLEKIHGIEGAKIERQKILDNGTNLHQSIEDYLNEKEPLEHHLFSAVLPLLKVVKQSEDLILERRIFCHQYKYQGKPDCIATYDGLKTVIDWTTSVRLKRKEWVAHKFLQAGAYAIACEEIGIKIEQLAVVVVCNEPKTYQVFSEEPTQWKLMFLDCLNKYNKLKN
jgi:hypothetical protein